MTLQSLIEKEAASILESKAKEKGLGNLGNNSNNFSLNNSSLFSLGIEISLIF